MHIAFLHWGCNHDVLPGILSLPLVGFKNVPLLWCLRLLIKQLRCCWDSTALIKLPTHRKFVLSKDLASFSVCRHLSQDWANQPYFFLLTTFPLSSFALKRFVRCLCIGFKHTYTQPQHGNTRPLICFSCLVIIDCKRNFHSMLRSTPFPCTLLLQ